jgi:hypothetical protein
VQSYLLLLAFQLDYWVKNPMVDFFEKEQLSSIQEAAHQHPSERCSVGRQKIVHSSRESDQLLVAFQQFYRADKPMMDYFEKIQLSAFRDVRHQHPSKSCSVGRQRIAHSSTQSAPFLLAFQLDYRHDKPVIHFFEREQLASIQDAAHQYPSES